MRAPPGPMANGIASDCGGKRGRRTDARALLKLFIVARMTKNPSLEVGRVLPAVGNFSVKEADAILEVAYLTTAADGRLSDEEYESFRAVAAKLTAVASGTE